MTLSQTCFSCVASARSSPERNAVIVVLVVVAVAVAACTGNDVRIDNAYFKIIVLSTQIVLCRISALQMWRLERVAIIQFFRAVKNKKGNTSDN